MRAYNIADINTNAGDLESDYTVKQFNRQSIAVRVHTLVARCDADAIDLACIMIGVDRAEVWQRDRFVYEILPCREEREPGVV